MRKLANVSNAGRKGWIPRPHIYKEEWGKDFSNVRKCANVSTTGRQGRISGTYKDESNPVHFWRIRSSDMRKCANGSNVGLKGWSLRTYIVTRIKWYTHKTSSYWTSSYKMSSYKTSTLVIITKRPVLVETRPTVTAAAINLASSALAMSFSRFELWAWLCPNLTMRPVEILKFAGGEFSQIFLIF